MTTISLAFLHQPVKITIFFQNLFNIGKGSVNVKEVNFRPVLVSEGDDDNDENDVDIIFENGKVKMSLQLC